MSAAGRREVIELAATEVFAGSGYHGASMDEIARRSGVSVPVLYDHFSSKKDLHRRLLERHFAELRGVWQQHFTGDAPPGERMARAFDAWFRYIQEHPYAWKVLFRDTSGDPEVEAMHAEVSAASRAALMPLLMAEAGSENIAGASDAESMELAWEVFRALLQGLALWWYEHPGVKREQLVRTAMNAAWIGFERVRRGEQWH
jgi:AcrR family transcriptional regulator